MSINFITAATVSLADLDNNVKSARHHYQLSKDSAAAAAAHAYLVWRWTSAADASENAKSWLAKEIEAVNAELEKLKKASDSYRLIKARKDASDFTCVVKYTLEFHKESQSSNVARYSTVLQWLDRQFGAQSVYDTDALKQAITAAGGFDAVIEAMRGKSSQKPAQDDGAQAAASKYLQEQVCAALTDKPAITTLTTQNSVKDWALLVVRSAGETVETVAELPVTQDQLYAAVGQQLKPQLLTKQPEVALIQRVFALGNLVEEGVVSKLTRNGIKSGEKLRSERVLIQRHCKGQAEFVYSARHAEASVVIIARPNSSLLNHDHGQGVLYLDTAAVSSLSGPIAATEGYFLDLSVAVEAPDRPVTWEITSKVPDQKPVSVAWSSLTDQEHRPLDVEGVKCRMSASLDLLQLAPTLKPVVDQYAEAKKDAEPVTLRSDAGQLCVTAGLVSVKAGSCSGIGQVQLRGQDLRDVLAALSKLNVSSVTLAVDEGGLVRFSWSDPVGTFEVNLPTLTADKKLETRRFVPMSLDIAGDLPAAA